MVVVMNIFNVAVLLVRHQHDHLNRKKLSDEVLSADVVVYLEQAAY